MLQTVILSVVTADFSARAKMSRMMRSSQLAGYKTEAVLVTSSKIMETITQMMEDVSSPHSRQCHIWVSKSITVISTNTI